MVSDNIKRSHKNEIKYEEKKGLLWWDDDENDNMIFRLSII